MPSCPYKKVHKSSSINRDNGIDDDSLVIECPSHYEALHGTATIQRFIAEIDGPFSKKLENLLAIFGHETQLEVTHSMKNYY